ncbi:hypothetical protein L6452_17521 [Arctium lappa]|uniref:Uncharacterized protein n=1 Tax=Arctium lappa TaxID=4217 RepID=A0ACB9C3N4_ARCLA|nr:hypothetical protein L6452_17521 [Arctium lappa]
MTSCPPSQPLSSSCSSYELLFPSEFLNVLEGWWWPRDLKVKKLENGVVSLDLIRSWSAPASLKHTVET